MWPVREFQTQHTKPQQQVNTKQDDEDPLGNLDQRVVSKTQIPIQLIGTFERAAQKEKMKGQEKRQQHA